MAVDHRARPSRRTLARQALGGLAFAGLAGGPAAALAGLGDLADYGPGSHLQAHIRQPGEAVIADLHTPGLIHLGLDRNRDAVLFTPPGLDFSKPVPLIVSLHYFGGNAMDGLSWFQGPARQHKFLLLSPPSRGETWNIKLGPVGPDAAFIDRALDWVFARFPIDPTHLAISGMSDGGSYALCLGLQNGDLFSDVLAFSPLQMNASQTRGRPRFFFSTGRDDDIARLPNGLALVKQLRDMGYDVEIDIHNKGHVVTEQGVNAAMKRFFG